MSKRAAIEKSGIYIKGVSNKFYYTIGMSKLGLPDVILFGGVRQETARHVLNGLYLKWRRFGYLGGLCGDIIADSDGDDLFLFVEKVENAKAFQIVANQYMVQTGFFYQDNPDFIGDNGYEIAQVFWPDENYLFPKDKGYNSDKYPQPILKELTK